jgi:hypothetical protein
MVFILSVEWIRAHKVREVIIPMFGKFLKSEICHVGALLWRKWSPTLGHLAWAPPPREHIGLFRREQKYFPATTESYRVYIGIGNQKQTLHAIQIGQHAEIHEPFLNGTSPGWYKAPIKTDSPETTYWMHGWPWFLLVMPNKTQNCDFSVIDLWQYISNFPAMTGWWQQYSQRN